MSYKYIMLLIQISMNSVSLNADFASACDGIHKFHADFDIIHIIRKSSNKIHLHALTSLLRLSICPPCSSVIGIYYIGAQTHRSTIMEKFNFSSGKTINHAQTPFDFKWMIFYICFFSHLNRRPYAWFRSIDGSMSNYFIWKCYHRIHISQIKFSPNSYFSYYLRKLEIALNLIGCLAG